MDQPRLKEPLPYIVGFALTYKQIYAAELDEVDIHLKYDGDPFLALRSECFFKRKEYDIIAFPTYPPDSDKAEVRYLYIIEVVPSWTGRNPHLTLTRNAITRFYIEHGCQPVHRRLSTACLPWPSVEPEPWWLKNHLWESIRIIQERRKARLALLKADSESDTTSQLRVNEAIPAIVEQTPLDDASTIKAEPSSNSPEVAMPPSLLPTRERRKVTAPQLQPSTRPRRACTIKNQRHAAK